MSKPFDATLNGMIDTGPDQWANRFARIAGIPPGPSVPVDTDLATTLQADKVFRFNGPSPNLLHLELEANPRTGIPSELLRYNTIIAHQNDLPVETVLILLRRKAVASDMTGLYQRIGVNGNIITAFRYHVERVWERPANFWLDAGPALAPLSLLTDEADANLETALGRFQESLRDQRINETLTKALIGSSFVLCGLRYNQDRIADTYRRMVMLMEDSTTYQWILEKGVNQGISLGQKNMLLRLGAKRFGQPSPSIASTLNAITDSVRFERLGERILDVNTWEELLAEE
ncbi:RpnC/YadD family protein [Zavarzinella formosa]|uniref:hypothetical protein n=1 Tax=Zavarzinella formosa TaxID=360055 RepID=UPI000307B272|nr:hypothetical protein [Zavarzinella formosa]